MMRSPLPLALALVASLAGRAVRADDGGTVLRNRPATAQESRPTSVESHADSNTKPGSSPAEKANLPTPDAASAADAKTKASPSAETPSGGQSAVERALAKPIKIDFVETPLRDVAASLSKQTGLNVLLDAKAITDAGGSVDTPITRFLAGVKLKSALRLMLSEHDLDFLDVDDNTLMITSAAVVRESMVTRFYDVHDLIRPKSDQSSPLDEIIELVATTVAPTSWSAAGGIGSISPFDNQLVITQSREAHAQIVDLLSTVRHVRDEPENYRDGGISQHSSPEAKIYRLLESKQDLDFVETPLKDAVESLKSNLGIEVQLDAKAILDAGGSIDMPISFKVKNMRLATALRLMLAPAELSFVIDHEVLLITSDAAAMEHVITRLYAVGDLLNQPWADARDEPAGYETLIDLITSIVHPASWDDAGGSGSIRAFPVAKGLVCTRTEQAHEDIVALLQKIRSLRTAKSAAAASSNNTNGESLTRFYRLAPGLADAAAEYITAIKRLVEPSTWTKDDAYIGKVPEGLVARCSPNIHRQIRELLVELEALPPKAAGNSGAGTPQKGFGAGPSGKSGSGAF